MDYKITMIMKSSFKSLKKKDLVLLDILILSDKICVRMVVESCRDVF